MASYEISILGTMAGQPIVNSHGLDWDNTAAPETVVEAAAAAEAAFAAWKSAFMVALSSGYNVTGAVARGVLNPLISGASTGPPASGQDASAPMPTFAAGKIKLQATEPGRAGRGRTGLCGLLETYNDSASPNRLTSAAFNTLKARVDAWFLSLQGGTPPRRLTVVTRFKGVDGFGKPIPRPTPFATSVQTVTLDAALGTRVSRLR